jgi:dynein heavy chain
MTGEEPRKETHELSLKPPFSPPRVAKVVAPKKAKLAEAEAEFNELMTGLNAKIAELNELESRLAELNAKLAEMQVRA